MRSGSQSDDAVGRGDKQQRGDDHETTPQTSSRLKVASFSSTGGFVGGQAGATGIPEMECQNMRLAEREQCALDDFWGMVANQVEQAEATAAMEREDQRSQDIRARIKKEERYTLWEKEDLRKRETRSIVKENLEDAARREYLEIFYSAPSAEVVINYTWPTRASLGPAWDQQSSDYLVGDTELALRAIEGSVGGGASHKTACGDCFSGVDDDPRSALSYGQTSRGIANDWRTTIPGDGDAGENPSMRSFHAFRGKKTHQVVHVNDCFIPPRQILEPHPKYGFSPPHGGRLALDGISSEAEPPYTTADPVATASSRLSKAVHLPPIAGVVVEGRSATDLAGSNEGTAVKGGGFSFNKRPLTADKVPLVSSFERKLAVRREQWSREAEAEAERRAFQEQLRARALLEGLSYEGDGGVEEGRIFSSKAKAKSGFKCQLAPAEEAHVRGQGSSRRTRRRHTWGCRWREGEDGGECNGHVAELIPEREEQLLTEMFEILDARNRGEVRLDEVLFYMTENAQVKSILKQMTLWTLTKTQRWKWVEDLLAAQPGRALTLPALLDFSRSLHEESRVPRKHLRIAKASQGKGGERRDSRARRLLPAELVEGSEVEALFRKGFQWYKAWIIRCHRDDTFDVRFTRPPSPAPGGILPPPEAALIEAEQRPEVETSSRFSGSEGDGSTDDEESSDLAMEEEWKATCDSVARFIGQPPDLGESERELLERAFDALVGLVLPSSSQIEQASEASKKEGDTTSSTFSRDCTTALTASSRARLEDEGTGGAAQRGFSWRPSPPHQSPEEDQTESTTDLVEPIRIPANDVIRLLRAGALDEYRRASPALSAACIYQEFAEGLEGAAGMREEDCEGKNGGSSGEGGNDESATGDCCALNQRVHHQTRRGQRHLGLSKEEFCDYFEAVTDLVDLNGLSLVPPVHEKQSRPASARAGDGG